MSIVGIKGIHNREPFSIEDQRHGVVRFLGYFEPNDAPGQRHQDPVDINRIRTVEQHKKTALGDTPPLVEVEYHAVSLPRREQIIVNSDSLPRQ